MNHADNDEREEYEETKDTLGHKIFNIFKPDTPPHQRAAKRLLLEAKKALQKRKQSSEGNDLGYKLKESKSVVQRQKALQHHSSAFAQESLFFRPIYKSLIGPYTKAEWEVILSNSVAKSSELARKDRYTACQKHILKLEHLSKARLKQSFVQGLHTVGCEQMRRFIW